MAAQLLEVHVLTPPDRPPAPNSQRRRAIGPPARGEGPKAPGERRAPAAVPAVQADFASPAGPDAGFLPAPSQETPAAGHRTAPRAPSAGARVLGRAALVVALATLASKLFGLLRETALADRFAATNLTDAYNVAALIPLVLFSAVGVAITTVFIPLFAELLAGRELHAAERFAANVNGVVTVTVGVLVLILEATAGPVVRTLLGAWPAAQQALCITLVRISSPLILFYAWSAVVGGVLNVRGFFGPNAAMGIPQNVIIIAAIVAASAGGRQEITLVAWGGLVGTFTTYLIQLPALRRSRFRVGWRFDLRDPLLRRMGRLVGPAALTALAQQTGSLLLYVLGSRLVAGMITDFTYASRLQLLAYSILGMSISTVVYPRLAAAGATGSMAGFRRTFVRGLGLVSMVTVPLAVGLFLLRVPAVHVAFQHGRFTPADTAATAVPLAFLSLGTVSYAWQDYMNRTFFALQDTRTPMLAALVGAGSGIGLALLLYRRLALAGLGLAMAVGWSVAVTFLIMHLRRRLGLVGGRRIAGSTARLAVAAFAGFFPARLLVQPLARHLGGTWAAYAAALGATGLLAVALYGACAAALRVPEVSAGLEVARGIWRRVPEPPDG